VQSRFKVANAQCHDIISNHVTASWWTTKGSFFSSKLRWANTKITTQWSMFYEAHAAIRWGHRLARIQKKERDSAISRPISIITTIFFLRHRAPDSNSSEPLEPLGQQHRLKLGFYASQLLGQINADFIKNKYKAGPLNGQTQHSEIEADTKRRLRKSGSADDLLCSGISVRICAAIGPLMPWLR